MATRSYRSCGSAKYAVRHDLDVIGAYYHYIQNSFFGTAPSSAPAASMRNAPDSISAAADWRFAAKWDLYFRVMFNRVHGGLGLGFFQHSNVDPTVGLRFRF